MEAVKKILMSPRPAVRALALYLPGVAAALAVAAVSCLLLPEGQLQKRQSAVELAGLGRSADRAVQIFGFNLLFTAVVVGGNLFAKCGAHSRVYLPYGYLALAALFVIYGLMIGTWSFQMAAGSLPFADRIRRMFDLREASGLLELASFCCTAAATANIAFVRVRGREVTTARLRDIRLTRGEAALLAAGILALFAAAWIEANSIARL